MRRDGWFVFAALALLAGWDHAGLDLPIERLFGSVAGFPLKEDWFTQVLLYKGSLVLAWGVFLLLLASFFVRLPVFSQAAKPLRIWWVVTTIVCLIVIPLLRNRSSTSCPWSLVEFGGTANYVSHWALGLKDGGPGRCFPSGHASTAFAFIAGVYAFRRSSPRIAAWWAAAVLVVGIIVSATQAARGAHFISHSLWTGWICWVITAVSYHLVGAKLAAKGRAAEADTATA